jgi:hypothetical protein
MLIHLMLKLASAARYGSHNATSLSNPALPHGEGIENTFV